MKKYICLLLSFIMLNVITPMVYASSPKYLPYEFVDEFHEGLASFVIYTDTNIKVGFIDTSGKVVIPAKDISTGNFNDGLAVFTEHPVFAKYGYIDKTGKVVISPKYDNPRDFSQGYAAVRVENRWWGYIDKTGKQITELKYDEAMDFSEGLAAVRVGEKWGYIDKTGQEVISLQYDYAKEFSEGLAAVRLDGKWGYIDQTGEVIIDINYDTEVRSFSEGLAVIRKYENRESKYGVIDKSGNEVLTPQYRLIKDFSEGLAAVQIDGKWGFIDKSGSVVIEPKYSDATFFNEGLAIVEKDGLEGMIDRTGKEVFGFKEDFTAKPFHDGFTIFRDGLYKSYIVKNPIKVDGYNKVSAKPTASKVLVDGAEVSFHAYNINGNNYLKLRDIAMVLNNTKKSFSVGWDGEKNAISLQSGKLYEVVGEELVVPASPIEEEGLLSNSTIYLDGKMIDLIAYTINGNSYFRLRDLSKALNFGVKWDGERNSIVIDSSSGYVLEG